VDLSQENRISVIDRPVFHSHVLVGTPAACSEVPPFRIADLLLTSMTETVSVLLRLFLFRSVLNRAAACCCRVPQGSPPFGRLWPKLSISKKLFLVLMQILKSKLMT